MSCEHVASAQTSGRGLRHPRERERFHCPRHLEAITWHRDVVAVADCVPELDLDESRRRVALRRSVSRRVLHERRSTCRSINVRFPSIVRESTVSTFSDAPCVSEVGDHRSSRRSTGTSAAILLLGWARPARACSATRGTSLVYVELSGRSSPSRPFSAARAVAKVVLIGARASAGSARRSSTPPTSPLDHH